VNTLDDLLWAIGQQESGGDYSADNGIAVGKYQVLKSNVPDWTSQFAGRSMTWQQFLQDPQAQDAVARGQLGRYFQQYGAAGAASAWYSGDPTLADSTRSQSGGPSIHDYVQEVLAYMAKAPAAGAPAAGTGTGSGATQAGLLDIPGDVLNWFSSTTDELAQAAAFLKAFFQPSTYIRAGAGLAGTAFLIAGLVFLAREASH
jgi:hypothetical protein